MTGVAPFAFATAGRILFGRGVVAQAGEHVAGRGRRVLLVQGAAGRGGAEDLARDLARRGCAVTRLTCAREPDLDQVTAGVARARAAGCECVVALGGGSVIDLGKAVAALAPGTGAVLDHLEGVGGGQPLSARPLPFVAIPTTAGTGAEVTANAVIGVPEHGRKVSLRDPRMLADLALVDPALTDGTPRAVTLASGLDAVTQVIEPYLTHRATPLTDALCRDAIPRGLSALARLMQAEDRAARDDLALVSLTGGLALANAGLGAVHGLAGVIGGQVPAAPHGAVCGVLLAPTLAANRAANAARSQPDAALAARLDWIDDRICTAFGLDHMGAVGPHLRALGLPGLRQMGVDPLRHAAIAEAARTASSMQANPVPLDLAALIGILQAAG